MDTLHKIKTAIRQAVGFDLDISYPPTSELGDLSLAVFALAKVKGQNQVILAQEISQNLEQNKKLGSLISDVKAVGPYVNLFLNYTNLGAEVLTEIKKAKNKYGQNDSGLKAGVMIEFSNGNTHKEVHIGHLRNICFGDAITKLLTTSGYKTIPVSYINDFGIFTAKTLWQYQKNQKQYQAMKGSQGYILGTCYKDAVSALEGNDASKAEVTRIMKAIESRQGEYYKLWQETRLWSIAYLKEVYQDLGIKFKKTFYESNVIADGLKIVSGLIKNNVLVKSEGAIIANLEKYNLGVLPIIRSDGTALYPVADLALAVKKFKENKITESIYIVDVRQELYFKQLFKILELMGYQQKITHLAYDFVTLPSGMMSSRSGNVITYRELIDESIANAISETKAKRADWSDRKIKKIATEITLSTIKFEMLKVSSRKTITFDIKEALKFEGYTATYLQYTHARIMSISKKSGTKKTKADYKLLSEPAEKTLIMKLAKYPETILRATEKYDPSEVTKYLFELCQNFNDFYHNVQIIKSKTTVKAARLELALAVGQIIKNGLELLGIQAINEI
ncbi:arginine--tRNA ligase [Candidatus Falkowbacteria bacterium CG10_big_fil_rev_8_21_14_0_10_39_9]|uniref:Arginine--tRNA ligase n=1 Tax=Candidatus Falkowbacteria bacterium CG10_big_fil_rev_8_21_14_0_10_39_9 TaxID=1974566 RepID=A0A2M6WPS5_9BACT|nr:MAG: arginine--tRNA ligase [Candidatus Falkowbacteria bacterium CG10_big_fil_rev_8_21_14_0_10_39_9]